MAGLSSGEGAYPARDESIVDAETPPNFPDGIGSTRRPTALSASSGASFRRPSATRAALSSSSCLESVALAAVPPPAHALEPAALRAAVATTPAALSSNAYYV